MTFMSELIRNQIRTIIYWMLATTLVAVNLDILSTVSEAVSITTIVDNDTSEPKVKSDEILLAKRNKHSGKHRSKSNVSSVVDKEDVIQYVNVRYGKSKKQTLDFWQVKSDKPCPVVIYMHGGGFDNGTKRKLDLMSLSAITSHSRSLSLQSTIASARKCRSTT